MKDKLKRLKQYLFSQNKYPITIFIVFSIFVFLLSYYSDNGYKNKDFMQGFIVELNGIVIEIFILSVIIYLINQKIETKNTIESLIQKINDFRHWKSDEASFIILATIKKLNANNRKNIDLHACHFNNTYLSDIQIRQGNLENTSITNSSIENFNVSDSSLWKITINNCNITNSNFTYNRYHPNSAIYDKAKKIGGNFSQRFSMFEDSMPYDSKISSFNYEKILSSLTEKYQRREIEQQTKTSNYNDILDDNDWFENFQKNHFYNVRFSLSLTSFTNFKESNFERCSFGDKIKFSNFNKCIIVKCFFYESIIKSQFNDAVILDSSFEHTSTNFDWESLLKARTLFGCRFPEPIKKLLFEKKPQLFDSYEIDEKDLNHFNFTKKYNECTY